MNRFILLAQTREAQHHELVGYVLAGLAFAVLIGGVIFNELRRKRPKK